jgi:hypothetical protein
MRYAVWLLAAVLVGALAWILWGNPTPVVAPGAVRQSEAVSNTINGTDPIGVKTPSATVPAKAADGTSIAPGQDKSITRHLKERPAPDLGFGQARPVKGDSSLQAASVLEALRTGAHPERLSLLHPPQQPFDRAAFEADPAAYLNVVQPGRVFQTKQPGKAVPALTVVGSACQHVTQGGSVALTVKGAPNAPVTFTSTDMGAFAENKLNSVSVRADDAGVAKVTFVAAPGALNDVNIMAGSPMASGQALFKVDIERKR